MVVNFNVLQPFLESRNFGQTLMERKMKSNEINGKQLSFKQLGESSIDQRMILKIKHNEISNFSAKNTLNLSKDKISNLTYFS